MSSLCLSVFCAILDKTACTSFSIFYIVPPAFGPSLRFSISPLNSFFTSILAVHSFISATFSFLSTSLRNLSKCLLQMEQIGS
ncbi:hypothetical protein QBC34DRAFT_409947 [Podospora aff. communis PSN243]|uniref:Secreted protein n=1 Tax=Podospora aff. communis PSN243 TaxID=3040156 RepID=A0AAV9GF04_9PEZI|nr:hypothetical protein QBC34DRAFT_409947 [Podospora aff. communis PSN243]